MAKRKAHLLKYSETRDGKRAPVKMRDVLKAAWADYKEHGGHRHQQFWEQPAKRGHSGVSH
ncbi:MAG: hypothetical protein L0Y71_20310 [Gemmataceae bacterium]|nr:hypothetical protein [Gemmataceae bacterium]